MPVASPAAGASALRGARLLRVSRPLSGPGATVGTNFKNSADLAIAGTVVNVAFAVALLVAFRERCRRTAHPIVDPALFRHRPFTVANLSQFGTQTAIFAWFFITPLFLVNVWHYSALAGGTAVAIGMIVSFVSIPVGQYSDRHGYRGVLVAGGLPVSVMVKVLAAAEVIV